MIDQKKFTELKAKYNIPQENNLSNSNFLYFILAKAEIDINFLNDTDWKWLSDNFMAIYELLQKNKELSDNRETIIQSIRKEQFSIYDKYSFIFESMPMELSYTKNNNDNNKSTNNTRLSSIILKIDAEGNVNEQEINYLKKYKLIKSKLEKLLEFVNLKRKYNVTNYLIVSPEDRLFTILKKLEDMTTLTDKDIKFINDKKLNSLLETYNLQQKQREEEFSQLKTKYLCENYRDNSPQSDLYKILKNIELGINITEDELNWLKNYDELKDTLEIAKFLALKTKYGVTDNPDFTPRSNLYKVLKNIDSNILLREQDINFLKKRNLSNLINTANQNYADFLINQIAQGKELNQNQSEWAEKNPEFKVVMLGQLGQIKNFDKLKNEYEVFKDYKSFNNELYLILKNLETGKVLEDAEIAYLKDEKLFDPEGARKNLEFKVIILKQIKDFNRLKNEYEVFKDYKSFDNKLYLILKNLEIGKVLEDAEIAYLKDEKLFDPEGARKNPEFKVIILKQIKDFDRLKNEYEVFKDYKSFDNELYLILKNLETGKLLEAIEIVYLKDKDLFHSDTKIYIRYYTIEALFYEENYKNTRNQWNIPNISSAWRKANQPDKALKTTENINLEKVKENKLKSAILTTRGASFRDIFHLTSRDSQLDEAEKCARQAIKFQPSSHHPYTLMGAICYDRYDYNNGDQWFAKAIERGASDQSIDVEIKKSLARMKDQEKRKLVAEGLIKKDQQRYSWAKQYLKQPKPKKVKK